MIAANDNEAALPSLASLELQEKPICLPETPKLLQITRKLGDGAQAKVYEAHYEGENNVNSFAVKTYSKQYAKLNDRVIEREFDILQKLNGHENVLKASTYARGNGKLQIPRSIPTDEYDSMARFRSGVDLEEDATFMAMELCKQDFFDLIALKGPIQSQSLAQYLFKQICYGVSALHTQAGYAHMDIKLENILIGKDYKLKLCDLGFSHPADERISKRLGTEGYIAPEIENRGYNETFMGIPADVFSLGVVLFIIIFGVPPFCSTILNDRNYRIFRNNPDNFWRLQPTVKKFVNKNGAVDKNLISLLTSMFQADPSKRPASIEEILSHLYFVEGGEIHEETMQNEFKKLVDSQ